MPADAVVTNPVRVGVIGAGGVATRRALPAIASAGGAVELAAVASRDIDRAQACTERFGGKPVAGYDELLGSSDIDAVYVAVPNSLHARWVGTALGAGLPVLAEKPLGTTVAEAEDLAQMAVDGGVTLVENFTFVHHRQHARVAELIHKGRIGQLRSMRAVFTYPETGPDDFRHRPELAGGALLDAGVYPVRLARRWLGDIEVRGAHLGQEPGEVDTGGVAFMTGSLGEDERVPVTLEFGMRHGYRSAYELVGSTGRLTVERAFTTPPDRRPDVIVEDASGVERPEWPAEDQWVQTWQAFAALVDENVPGPADDVVAQARVVAEIRSAASV